MTIILFLIDTSSSMCQKAYVNGVQKSYLDIAKGAVETFLKYRQRTQDCLGDRYMLLTFEEPPANVKAGWKENHATFMNELKNLQSTGLTSMGESLKNAFDLLNLNRMQSGIDTYGQGRCPFYLEPSVIIVITDGGRYSYRNGVHQDIILPLNTQIPGTKFTKEPFRWDQRLFSLVLRMSGNRVDERVEGKVPHDDSPIERMCEVTGGRSYRVRSHYVLNQCIESLVQKVQPGVVLQFEPMLPKEGIISETLQDIAFQPTKKMIYVQKHITQKTFPIGYWPLPEPYWPDPKAVTLTPRDAHPKIKIVTPSVDEPQMVRSFPVDKYEIEASPLTLQILQKREMSKCWQVIISNGMHGFELPFGYLKAAPNFTQVHLYVLAYNYPALLPLLHDLIHKYNMSPPNDLMYKFNAYVRSIPPYYCPFLRKALLNINVPYQLLQFLLPENVDNYLSPNIANQLKHIKNTAKQDQENNCLKVYKQLKQPKPPYRQVETAKLNPGVPLRRDLVRHPLLRDTFHKLHTEIEPLENYTIVVPQMTRQASAKTYRNPFDIPRRDLIEEIARMRETILRPTPTCLAAKDSGHCLPIAEMGNYQEYLKNKDNPLREIEPTNVRQHMFGNPYKKDKHMVMVDEADLSDVAPMKSNNGGVPGGAGPSAGGVPGMGAAGGGMPGIGVLMGGAKKIDASRVRKRKAGPIRKDFIFRRTSTDVRPSTPSSSVSSAGSSVGELSDFDDDASSDAASLSSGRSEDGDPDRLVVAFDFNEEEPNDPDFPLNGYVRNFINGISDESSADFETKGASSTQLGASVGATVGGGGPGGGAAGGANSIVLPVVPPTTTGGGLPAGAMPHLAHPHLLTLPMNSNGLTVIHSTAPAAAAAPSPHPYLGNYSPAVLGADALGATGHHGLIVPNSTGFAGASAGGYAPHQLNGNAYGGLVTSSAAAAVASSPLPATMVSGASAVTATAVSVSTPPSSAFHHLTHAHPHTHPHPHQQHSHPHPPAHPLPHHNDINDPQEISRILQQCHNGNVGSMGPTAATGYPLIYEPGAPHELKAEPEAALMMPPPQSPSLASASLSTLTTSPAAAAVVAANSFDSLKRELGATTSIAGVSLAGAASSNSSHHNSLNHVNNNNSSSSSSNYSNSTANCNNAYASGVANHVLTASHNHLLNNNSSTNSVSDSNNHHPEAFPAANEPALTDEQREAARQHNLKLRAQVFRDIRRPGRNYGPLLEHLNLVKGDYEMKLNFVEMCISESLRFRRRQMVNSIQDWWEQQQQQQLTQATAS